MDCSTGSPSFCLGSIVSSSTKGQSWQGPFGKWIRHENGSVWSLTSLKLTTGDSIFKSLLSLISWESEFPYLTIWPYIVLKVNGVCSIGLLCVAVFKLSSNHLKVWMERRISCIQPPARGPGFQQLRRWHGSCLWYALYTSSHVCTHHVTDSGNHVSILSPEWWRSQRKV